MSKPIKIGITGGIGGGKSVFSRYLMRRGELVYDTDLEAKILQNYDAELIAATKAEFGDDIYNDEGLDRKRLASIVFSQPERLKTLTNLVHPAVKADFVRWAEANSERKFLFMECAVLFEGNFVDYVDKVVVVTADEQIRIERVMRRDNISEEQVRARIKNQINEAEKKAHADWVFDTGSSESPHIRVDHFLEQLYASY